MTAKPPVGPSSARSRATAAPCGRAARRAAADRRKAARA